MGEIRKLAAEARKLAAEAEAEVQKLKGDASAEPVPGKRYDVTVTAGVASASGSVMPDKDSED